MANKEIILNNFFHEMTRQIAHNQDKGDLLAWDHIGEILYELEYHRAKLLIALKEENKYAMKEYIADCANILLALGNQFNLYDEPDLTKDKVDMFHHIIITKENKDENISLQ